MSNYNEALDSEKRTLALLVETNFYPQEKASSMLIPSGMDSIIKSIQDDPALAKQFLQALLSHAADA